MISATACNRVQYPAGLLLPFAHLNLCFNPFGEIPLEHRAELAVVDLEPVLKALVNRRAAVQLLGDKGRGKTTHLLALMEHFPRAAYVHIPEDDKPPIPVGDPLLIDEVQRVPPWSRLLVFRRRVPLVLGTHEDYSDKLQRAGRKVTTIEVGEGLDASRLQTLLKRRIEFARRGPGPLPQITCGSIDRLLLQFATDIRAIEGRLYDVFQNLTEPGNVEV